MKKTVPFRIRATVSIRKGFLSVWRWYEQRLGFWDIPESFARHHADDDFIEPSANR